MTRTTLKERQSASNWPVCHVEGCERSTEILLRGLCGRHLQKWRKYGDPLAGRTFETHGEAKRSGESREYVAWQNMRKRCHDKKDRKWRWYGARGIKVCSRWDMSFTAFLADMGRSSPGLSLDRKDSNRDYEPGNCRWVNSKIQQSNRSHVVLNPGIVLEIRRRYDAGELPADIAKDFPCGLPNLRLVCRRKAWEWVK